jgi:GxxExxY protein
MAGVALSTNRGTNYRIDTSDRLTYPVIGAAMRVHNRLGPGLKEAHYQQALSIELERIDLAVVPEQTVQIQIDGQYVGLLYLDHVVEDELIVEEKSVPHLLRDEEVAQLITYLCATGKKVGLLLNFGRNRLEYRRIFAPRNVGQWRSRIRRHVWMPPEQRFANSLRRRPFVDSSPGDPR